MQGWFGFGAALLVFFLSHAIPVRPPVRPWLVAGVAMFVVIRLTRSLEADTPTPQAAQEAAHWCGFTRRIAAVFLVGWAVAQTLVVLGSGRDFALLVAYIFGLALIVMGSRAVWTRPVSPTVTPSRRMAISLGFTLAFVALGALWVADMVIILWVCIYLVGLPVLLPLITRLVRGSAQVLIPGDEEDTAEGTEGTEGAEAAAPVHSGPKLVPRVPSIRSVIVDRGARLLVLALAMGWLMSVLNSHAERFMQTEVVTRLIGGVFQGIIVLIVADFLWQLAKVAILQREAEALQFTTDPEQRARNSRLRTLLPILRHTVAVLIAIVAVLTVLAGLIAGVIVIVLIVQWWVAQNTDPPFAPILEFVALYDQHYQPFMEGRLVSTGVAYYSSLTFVFLMLATKMLGLRRWS